MRPLLILLAAISSALAMDVPVPAGFTLESVTHAYGQPIGRARCQATGIEVWSYPGLLVIHDGEAVTAIHTVTPGTPAHTRKPLPRTVRGQATVAQPIPTASESAEGFAVAENGSAYGDISELTGRPKTVPVRHYQRRDGTEVRSHYRSPPLAATAIDWSQAWLKADDGTFLGTLDPNRFEDRSIFNKFGPYGSKYEPESPLNQYGMYGGRYGLYSPENPYSATPPTLMVGAIEVIKVSSNRYLAEASISLGEVMALAGAGR